MHQIEISAMHAGMIVIEDCYNDEYLVLDKVPKHAYGGVCMRDIKANVDIEVNSGTWIYVREN